MTLLQVTDKGRLLLVLLSFAFINTVCQAQSSSMLTLNDSAYFETRGLNVLVFSNWYNGLFSDSKMSGVELIHHGQRTATNGDVRLNPTPEQWDAIPQFVDRQVDWDENRIVASLAYPDYGLEYSVEATVNDNSIHIAVNIKNPLPEELEGRVGFNMEFLPSAYFGATYMMDDQTGSFPAYPSGPMEITSWGKAEPLPLASGKMLTLAPEDPLRRIRIATDSNELMLYDGRNKAQNGWFVVRSLIPSGRSGTVVEWRLTANTIPDWKRPPMIAHSQVGYHPAQEKVAVVELDKNEESLEEVRILKINSDGSQEEKLRGMPVEWGVYLRYKYAKFDFSSIREEGIYRIGYGDQVSGPFRIARNAFEDTWTPTSDVFFPVQMDHMFVNEAYRVWHGASHLDDALQAPVNHEHFDLYGQGPTTDSPFQPGEHIPGLNIGGWYDAGDYDIRTQTQYATVMYMVQIWENFRPNRDETTINQDLRYVDIHVPDGKPDLLQQIEHGTLALIAQHRVFGRAIPGIVEAHLSQYTHLGDAVTKTDNLIFSPELDSLERKGNRSGTFDDRWAFTSKTTPLNYGSIAALAAASRALRDYNNDLADECLSTAVAVWDEEHSHEPDIFYVGNTTGGRLDEEELKAAVELLIATQDPKYAKRVNELWPTIEQRFSANAHLAVRAMPYMNKGFGKKLANRVNAYKSELDDYSQLNPFGVPVTTGGWAGNGAVIHFALTNYWLHKAFPEIIGAEHSFRGLNYIYGVHPGSNTSFVSGVGAKSSVVAYGSNRADFSYIAGGVVPGVLILPPDYPENMQNWPFLWGENEYVINVGASYMLLVHAVNDLLAEK